MRAENRGRRNPLGPRAQKRAEKDLEQELSTLDFLLDILSLSRRPIDSNVEVKGDHSLKHNGFDYSFSLLSTVLLIILIGMAALGGLVLVLALLT